MRTFTVPVVTWLLLGCGPKTGGPSETGTDSGTGGGSSTGAISCQDYLDTENIGPPVDITVENGSDSAIWIPAVGCGGLPLVEIIDAGGESISHYGSECSPVGCFEFLESEDCTLGCNDCAPPSWLHMEAGASITLTWSGVRRTTLEMSPACADGVECQRSCERADQAAPGAYDLRVTAYRSCTGECDCFDPPQNGWCPIWEPAQTADETPVTIQLSYPEQSAITVAIPPA